MNARNREMTGVSDYVCTSTFCVRRSNSERDWTLLRRSATLHCRSIHASFVDFVQGACVLVSTLILTNQGKAWNLR